MIHKFRNIMFIENRLSNNKFANKFEENIYYRCNFVRRNKRIN